MNIRKNDTIKNIAGRFASDLSRFVVHVNAATKFAQSDDCTNAQWRMATTRQAEAHAMLAEVRHVVKFVKSRKAPKHMINKIGVASRKLQKATDKLDAAINAWY